MNADECLKRILAPHNVGISIDAITEKYKKGRIRYCRKCTNRNLHSKPPKWCLSSLASQQVQILTSDHQHQQKVQLFKSS